MSERELLVSKSDLTNDLEVSQINSSTNTMEPEPEMRCPPTMLGARSRLSCASPTNIINGHQNEAFVRDSPCYSSKIKSNSTQNNQSNEPLSPAQSKMRVAEWIELNQHALPNAESTPRPNPGIPPPLFSKVF